MRTTKAKSILTTAVAAATITAGPMAAGAVAQDLCEIDPATGECFGEPIDDGSFFPDSAFIPGADYFPDSAFVDNNPNSDDISFPDSTFMPSCSEDGEFLVGFGTFVVPNDRLAVTDGGVLVTDPDSMTPIEGDSVCQL